MALLTYEAESLGYCLGICNMQTVQWYTGDKHVESACILDRFDL